MSITRNTIKSMILLAASLLGVFPAFCTTLAVSPPMTNTTGGQLVSLDIDVSDISDPYAWQFDVDFDPSIVSVVSISEGTFLASGGTTFFVPGTIDNSDGSISFNADTLIGALVGVDGSGTLATVEFNAIGAGDSAVTLNNIILLDSNVNNIDFTSTDGSINVSGTAVVPEPNSVVLILAGVCCFGAMRRLRAAGCSVRNSMTY
jgi:hypothetical protein